MEISSDIIKKIDYLAPSMQSYVFKKITTETIVLAILLIVCIIIFNKINKKIQAIKDKDYKDLANTLLYAIGGSAIVVISISFIGCICELGLFLSDPIGGTIFIIIESIGKG